MKSIDGILKQKCCENCPYGYNIEICVSYCDYALDEVEFRFPKKDKSIWENK
jgi:hypothetical protein